MCVGSCVCEREEAIRRGEKIRDDTHSDHVVVWVIEVRSSKRLIMTNWHNNANDVLW